MVGVRGGEGGAAGRAPRERDTFARARTGLASPGFSSVRTRAGESPDVSRLPMQLPSGAG